MKNTILILSAFFFYTCQFFYKEELKQENLFGDWVLVDDFDNGIMFQEEINWYFSHPSSEIGAYEFTSDGVLINKFGFFNIERDYKESTWTFMGNSTHYSLNKENLHIYNIYDNQWEIYKILKISKDSLQLKDDNFTYNFYRLKKENNSLVDFDAVVVSSTGIMDMENENIGGLFMNRNVMITNQGELFYFGEYSNPKNGAFKGNITTNKYDSLISQFNKTDLLKLNEIYEGSNFEPRFSITFLKDNKIVKTICDYSLNAPINFIGAYLPIFYLPEEQELQPWNVYFGSNLAFWGDGNINGRTFIPESENFALFVQLQKAPIVTKDFNPKYIFASNNKEKQDIDSVLSDGRYYYFDKKTYDLGHNFFEK